MADTRITVSKEDVLELIRFADSQAPYQLRAWRARQRLFNAIYKQEEDNA